ncbi:MAG: formate--tetrahydrofolate ligase, partial [Candidatus Omnitrophota bacterium]
MLSDIQISKAAKLKPILKIAKSLGLKEKEIDLYGKFKAKIHLEALNRLKQKKHAKYILITGITPTPFGEGKTVNTIGLSMALNKIGKRSIACIRQPSTGPLFGIKGGAAGGGFSQVVPMEDLNLHFTGDIHAVSLAHNLAASFLDNHLYHGNSLNIDASTISWHRVLDLSDRFLRHIKIGLGAKQDGIPRDSGFDIAVASEVMAILSLTNNLSDLRKRLGKIILAENLSGIPITAGDLKVAGSMAALLKEAIEPNLIQTLENTPVIVHTSPFGNIAHGNSSILADKLALSLTDYVVTEAGFGADCGAEKFMDIKCRVSGLTPDCVVIVCSIRALKMHSGKFKVIPGRALDKNLLKENLEAVQIGSCNLAKQIENMLLFGVPVVVCINKFDTDI